MRLAPIVSTIVSAVILVLQRKTDQERSQYRAADVDSHNKTKDDHRCEPRQYRPLDGISMNDLQAQGKIRNDASDGLVSTGIDALSILFQFEPVGIEVIQSSSQASRDCLLLC